MIVAKECPLHKETKTEINAAFQEVVASERASPGGKPLPCVPMIMRHPSLKGLASGLGQRSHGYADQRPEVG
jgi:hypothetical protein